MSRVLLSDHMSFDLRVIHLSDRAYRVYISAICYAARWELRTLALAHVRMTAGPRCRRYVTELVDAELAEWVDEKEFRLLAEGDLWKRLAPSRRHIPERLRTAVYERDGYACVECGDTERLSLDHIYPYSLGGTDDLDNLQTLCRSCNSTKGAKV